MADPGPLPGLYQEFFLPIIKDATAAVPDGGAAPGVEKYERAYMKEAVGFFLNLPVAPNRTGTFGGDGLNKGRKFNYRKQRASRSYTLILFPNTPVNAYGPTKANPTSNSKVLLKNSMSFSVPRTVGVSEMMAWLTNYEVLLNELWSAMASVEGNQDSAPGNFNNYLNILSLVTPWDRKHNVRTLLDNPSEQNIESDPSAANTSDPLSTQP